MSTNRSDISQPEGHDLTPKERQRRIEQILQQLHGIIRDVATNLIEAGRLIRKLDDLGADTSDLKMWWVYFVRKVAYEQLLPELAAKYWGNRTLLTIVARLPKPQQEILVQGKGVELLIYTPNGQLTTLMVQPLEMTPKHLRQAFADDHIRTESEQRAWLAADMAETKHKPPERLGEWRIDFELNTAKHGNKTFALAELEAVTRAMRRGRRRAS